MTFNAETAGHAETNTFCGFREFRVDCLLVAVDGRRRECGQAHGDVLSAVGARRAVADPLARRGDDGLTFAYVDGPAFMLDVQRALEHDRDLLEVRTLSRL